MNLSAGKHRQSFLPLQRSKKRRKPSVWNCEYAVIYPALKTPSPIVNSGKGVVKGVFSSQHFRNKGIAKKGYDLFTLDERLVISSDKEIKKHR